MGTTDPTDDGVRFNGLRVRRVGSPPAPGEECILVDENDVAVRITSRDRVILEEEIIPRLTGKVLFIGCESYTAWYRDLFEPGQYWTIEVDPTKASFGSPHHVVGDATALGETFSQASFDAIVANGVLGWGIDSPEQIAKFTRGAAHCLRGRGILVLGWNDNDERRPVAGSATVEFQERFRPTTLGTFGERVDSGSVTRHVFEFFERIP